MGAHGLTTRAIEIRRRRRASTTIIEIQDITRSGDLGSWAYTPGAGLENAPVEATSFFIMLRFANWMNNGQGNGDTETGAYPLVGGRYPINGVTVTRNAGATIVLPNEEEWYKAAYYDPTTASYVDHPTSPVSPYGTFGQADGSEWNETIGVTQYGYEARQIRGGDASKRYFAEPYEGLNLGFRLAMIPEPGTNLLLTAGLLGLGMRRRLAWREPRESRRVGRSVLDLRQPRSRPGLRDGYHAILARAAAEEAG